MRSSAALPPGVQALFFDSARRRRELEGSLVEHLDGAGFAEVVLPILDYLAPYEPMLSKRSRGRLYRFVDRDGELLALRSDFTPMLGAVAGSTPRLARVAAAPLLPRRRGALAGQPSRAAA